MVWVGREVQYQKDNILGTYFCLFRNVAVRDPRHNLDHYLVIGCLCSSPMREHTKYLGRPKRIRLWTLTTPTMEDGIFESLQRSILKPKPQEARKNAWILADPYRLVNKRVSTRRDPTRDQAQIQRLGRAIKASLKEDRCRWTEEAGKEVERLLGSDPPSHKEA